MHFPADEDDPDYTSPAGHYSEINEETATAAANDDRTPAGGPYEGLRRVQVRDQPAVTIPVEVYVPLRRVARSDTPSRADGNKRVRSLPILGHLQETVTVQ